MSTAIPILKSRARARTLHSSYLLRTTAIAYLAVMILVPLIALVRTGLSGGLSGLVADITNPIAFSSLELTLGLALVMTLVNAVMGTLTAWVLVRLDFPGRGLLNAIIDLPFAIPTLVTGVMLIVLFGPQQLLGAWFERHGIRIVFDRPGIVLALLFVTYPFVIRTVQPVLMELRIDQEEAAFTMGASKWLTFKSIVLPAIAPAIVSGSLLSFGRALGEFGSVVAVAGNIPGRTLTAPVYLFGQIESQNIRGASAISLVLLVISFALLILVDVIQRRKWSANAND